MGICSCETRGECLDGPVRMYTGITGPDTRPVFEDDEPLFAELLQDVAQFWKNEFLHGQSDGVSESR